MLQFIPNLLPVLLQMIFQMILNVILGHFASGRIILEVQRSLIV